MIVQLDEAGEQNPAGLDHMHTTETRRGGLCAVLDRDEAALVDVHDAVGQDRERVVHRHYESGQRLLRTGEGIDGEWLLRRRLRTARPREGTAPVSGNHVRAGFMR